MGRKKQKERRCAVNLDNDMHAVLCNLAVKFDEPLHVVVETALREFNRFSVNEQADALAERRAEVIRNRVANRQEISGAASPVH